MGTNKNGMKVEEMGLGDAIKTGFGTKLTELDALLTSDAARLEMSTSKYGKSQSLMPEYLQIIWLSENQVAFEQYDP